MRAESLPLDVVVHVHQVADGADIVGDVGIAVDGVLDGAACHRKVDHVHSLIVVQHGVDQTAGKGIAAAHAVQNIKGVELALKGVAVVPHKGLEAVLAAAVGIAHMAGNALEVGVAGNEVLEDLVLLLIAGLQGHAVLPVALGVVALILPQVVRLNAKQHIHIGRHSVQKSRASSQLHRVERKLPSKLTVRPLFLATLSISRMRVRQLGASAGVMPLRCSQS